MKLSQKLVRTPWLALALVLPAAVPTISAQQPTPAERVAELKATMAASKVVLRQFEWIQTTVISLKGDVQSRKQERCYYGADGKVEKVMVYQSPPPPRKRGLRGRIAEAEEKKLKEYMQDAEAVVHEYVPPDQARLQADKDAGNLSVQVLDPKARAQLTFSDYQKPGDSLSLVVNLANNHPVSGQVKTYMDSDPEKNPVTLKLAFSTLENGTTYLFQTVLSAPDKELTVTVEDSGYRKTSQ